jgi:hypothetical protein
MDLLSMVSMATKRRSDYITQAKDLAKKYKDYPVLENRMAKDSELLVKGLRDKLMRWDEYERSLVDKTLTSALAAFILGVGDDKTDRKIETAWPIVVGDMLPLLTKFLAETKEYIDDGTLRIGDRTLDFADYDLVGAVPGAIDLKKDELLNVDPAKQGTNEAIQSVSRGRTWPGLFVRVVRYLANPTYSFFNLGSYMKVQDLGYKEMRRVSKKDKKCCADCKNYDTLGWQPIGSLPMPGKGCRCYDHCRCEIDYR